MHIPMGHKLFILMTDVASLRYFMGRSLLIRIVFRVCMAVYAVRLILIEFRSLSLRQFIPSVNALPVNIPYGLVTESLISSRIYYVALGIAGNSLGNGSMRKFFNIDMAI